MEKFFRWLYYGGLTFFVVAVVYLTLALFFSPRQDALKRGFIPCTEKLVTDLNYCSRGTIKCPMRLLWQDTKCNLKVITDGFGLWLAGKQTAPWSNYWFIPAISQPLPNASESEISTDMSLDEQFMAHKKQELEAAQNRHLNLNEKVLISDPEGNKKLPKNIYQSNEILDAEIGNIDDEAFLDDIHFQSSSVQKTTAKHDDEMLQHKKLKQINNQKVKEKQNEK